MAYGSISLERRLKENNKNYTISNLLDIQKVREHITALYELCGVGVLFTDRHGEVLFSCGNFDNIIFDVVKEPGIKLQVAGRTVAHIYQNMEDVPSEKVDVVSRLVDGMVEIFANLAETSFYQKETSTYADEMENRVLSEKLQAQRGEYKDALTDVLNALYFAKRMKVIDRAQFAPVAAICVNINDWKYANDHFGDEESDRLIQIIANILIKESKPDYVIGRVDGDVFHIIIPIPEEGEAEAFCIAVREACLSYEDPYLAPSVAVGMVYKENVEMNLADVFSDAEYEMFQDKYQVKNKTGYRERLEKGIVI